MIDYNIVGFILIVIWNSIQQYHLYKCAKCPYYPTNKAQLDKFWASVVEKPLVRGDKKDLF